MSDLHPDGWREAVDILAAAEHARRMSVEAKCVHLRNGINDCGSVAYGIWKALPSGTRNRLLSVPGLPSSFPVGSVSGAIPGLPVNWPSPSTNTPNVDEHPLEHYWSDREYSPGVGIAKHVRPPGAPIGAKPTWQDQGLD